jgi:hypothetical protein
MSMGLYSLPEVYHSSWIEMKPDIAMRFEVDRHNQAVTLYFGHRDQCVMILDRNNLNRLVDLGASARQELTGPPVNDQ